MKLWISAALLLVLTACSGGSGGSDESGSDAAQKAALEQAYRTYVEAFLSGDGATAYRLLSDRCRDEETPEDFGAIADSAGELYGDVDYTINAVTVDGDSGSVDATYAVKALDTAGGSPWVYEDGEWHSDKCG